jgi:hypothetical protein
MLKGALLYGGMIYLTSGGGLGLGGSKRPLQYTEERVEF